MTDALKRLLSLVRLVAPAVLLALCGLALPQTGCGQGLRLEGRTIVDTRRTSSRWARATG